MRRYFALLLLLIPRPSAASCVNYPDYIHWLGGVNDFFYQAQGIAVSGSLAYVADGTDGLQIVYKASPTHPYILGSVRTPGMATDVVVSGFFAYVSARNAGLQ